MSHNRMPPAKVGSPPPPTSLGAGQRCVHEGAHWSFIGQECQFGKVGREVFLIGAAFAKMATTKVRAGSFSESSTHSGKRLLVA